MASLCVTRFEENGEDLLEKLVQACLFLSKSQTRIIRFSASVACSALGEAMVSEISHKESKSQPKQKRGKRKDILESGGVVSLREMFKKVCVDFLGDRTFDVSPSIRQEAL